MCSARWMFSMLTSRMKSGCDSWWSKVSSASRRIAATGSRWSTSIVCSAAADRGVGALEHGHEQLLLAAEVVVDHPLRGARLVGDLVHARAREALVGELARRHLEDLRPSALGVALALREGARDHGSIVGVWQGARAGSNERTGSYISDGRHGEREDQRRRAVRRGPHRRRHRRVAEPRPARARGVAARASTTRTSCSIWTSSAGRARRRRAGARGRIATASAA